MQARLVPYLLTGAHAIRKSNTDPMRCNGFSRLAETSNAFDACYWFFALATLNVEPIDSREQC